MPEMRRKTAALIGVIIVALVMVVLVWSWLPSVSMVEEQTEVNPEGWLDAKRGVVCHSVRSVAMSSRTGLRFALIAMSSS